MPPAITVGVELGRDDAGNVVMRVTGQTSEGSGPIETVCLALSEEAAMQTAEAIKRCVFSEEVHFEWTRKR
jgi:hypothetical protein